MKKHYSLFFAFFLMLSVGLVSCKQSETPPAPTNTDLISQLPWFFLSATAGGTDVSNTPQLACFKDNTTTFTALGSFSINEGAIVCSPSTAGTFSWVFQSNETQIVLSAPLFPGGSGTFNIVSLTSTSLVLSQNVTIPPSSTPVLVTFSFRH